MSVAGSLRVLPGIVEAVGDKTEVIFDGGIRRGADVVRAMGLGASLVTMPLWSVTSARRILGLPTSVTPFCVVPLGWPRGRYGPTTRRPVEEVVHLDGYGTRAWLDH